MHSQNSEERDEGWAPLTTGPIFTFSIGKTFWIRLQAKSPNAEANCRADPSVDSARVPTTNRQSEFDKKSFAVPAELITI